MTCRRWPSAPCRQRSAGLSASLDQSRSQLDRVPSHYQAGFVVADQVNRAARGRDHHWKPAGDGLMGDHRERLALTGQDQDVGALIERSGCPPGAQLGRPHSPTPTRRATREKRFGHPAHHPQAGIDATGAGQASDLQS